MRLSLLAPAFALAAFASAQSSNLSDEMRQEIRAIIREEIRAAMKEHAATATTVKTATAVAPKKMTAVTVSPEGAKAHSFEMMFGDDLPKGMATTKAFRMTDGKMVEVNFDDMKSVGGFKVFTQTDGTAGFDVMKPSVMKKSAVVAPKSATRVLTLSPTTGEGDHQIEFVMSEGAEQTALAECCKALEASNECCEAVKVVVKKGEGEEECCEGGECVECVVEVEDAPAKKSKKNKDKKKGAKKAKATDDAKAAEVIELKIGQVLEKLKR